MNVISKLRKNACLVATLALLVGQAISSHAQTILIDFGSDTSFRGLSVPVPTPTEIVGTVCSRVCWRRT